MKNPVSQENAEQIALQALTYLVQEPELIGTFLAETGVGPHELKPLLQEPTFLGGLLDFFLRQSDLLLKFSEASNLKPQDILFARLHFPGAQEDTWLFAR